MYLVQHRIHRKVVRTVENIRDIQGLPDFVGKWSPGIDILLTDVAQDANREIGVPGFELMRLASPFAFCPKCAYNGRFHATSL
jgi:hypothetical protein